MNRKDKDDNNDKYNDNYQIEDIQWNTPSLHNNCNIPEDKVNWGQSVLRGNRVDGKGMTLAAGSVVV